MWMRRRFSHAHWRGKFLLEPLQAGSMPAVSASEKQEVKKPWNALRDDFAEWNVGREVGESGVA